MELLRSDLVAVTTPAGTDLVFRVGDRPFNLQDGDASPDRMRLARTRIDREIELPAGVVRVAPLEETVSGTMVVPRARFGDAEVEGLVLEFVEGRIVELSADAGELAVREALEASPALNYFRELGIGFNPALTAPPGEPWIPYFGYGAGVVRLSLGNNGELGGSVTGDGVRWLFFPDATVRVGETTIVRDGVLTAPSG